MHLLQNSIDHASLPVGGWPRAVGLRGEQPQGVGGTHNFYRNVLGISRSGVDGWEKLQESCLNVHGGTGMRIWNPRGIQCTLGGKCEPRARNNPSITPKSSKKGQWGDMLRLLKSDLGSRWPTFKGHRAQSQKPLPGKGQGWHMGGGDNQRFPLQEPRGTSAGALRHTPGTPTPTRTLSSRHSATTALSHWVWILL